MEVASLLRNEMKNSHDWLEATMADVTSEMAHELPPGVAHPIAACYAHVVVGEDSLMTMLTGGAPVYTGEWQGRTGLTDPQAAFYNTLEWAQNVKLDLPALKQYAQAVYANTDAYLASVTPEQLDETVDLSQMNMGVYTKGSFLLGLILCHVRDLMGEISALKGVQGSKGYPF